MSQRFCPGPGFAKTGEGRRRDVNTVRTWDPTHPAFSGTYRAIGMSHLGNADVFGYYDFHWKRGRDQHFPHLLQYAAWARERNALFYRWAEVDAGLAGKGNANRCQYTVTTSAACGLKGVLWFLGTSLLNKDTLEWTAHGEDIVKVNREVMPLSKELARIGNPSAIYSTPITKTANNEPLPDGKKEMMPPGLENNKVPAAFAVQPAGGEFVLGVFQDPEDRQALFVANHNAYEGQDIELKLTAEGKVSLFDRLKGQWTSLEVKEKSVRFRLAAAGGELLRLEK